MLVLLHKKYLAATYLSSLNLKKTKKSSIFVKNNLCIRVGRIFYDENFTFENFSLNYKLAKKRHAKNHENFKQTPPDKLSATSVVFGRFC